MIVLSITYEYLTLLFDTDHTVAKHGKDSRPNISLYLFIKHFFVSFKTLFHKDLPR